MALVGRTLAFAVVLVTIAGPVAAATLGLAWDASPDASVVGYRVFVGTSPGRHTETFDVHQYQTSFHYTIAVPGRRYYFAVASIGQGAVVSDKSAEVSAIAAIVQSVGDLARPSVAPRVASPSPVTEIASGLGEITAMVALPTGGGLVVEDGTRLLAFSNQGLAGLVYAASARTRIAALAVDPQFQATGLVYVAEARLDSGDEDVAVVRHRLLVGTLGESAAIVIAGRQPAGTSTGLTIAANGDVVLAQGPRVTRFQQDGSVVRSEPATLGASADVVPALAWDAPHDGVWSVWVGSAADLESAFVRLGGGDAPVRATIRLPAGGDASAAGVAVLNDGVIVATATESTVFRVDLATSHVSAGTPVGTRGTVASILPIESDVDLVVVREPVVNGKPSYSLLRLRHADGP